MSDSQTVFYPQDELTTMLVPVCSGCPYNGCAFCAMYKDEKYAPIPLSQVEFHLKHGYEYTEKLFLTGADPMCLGYERLSAVLRLVKRHLPFCARVAAYASVRSILKYAPEELSSLHDMGLRLLYIGFESGSDKVLEFINKGSTAADSLKAAKMLNGVRLPFNSIIMYGIAGSGNERENAVLTAEMLNQFTSQKIITMNLTLFEGTKLRRMAESGEFAPQSGTEKLWELRTLVERLDPPSPALFDTTHPTNMIRLRGALPEERTRLLELIDAAIGCTPVSGP